MDKQLAPIDAITSRDPLGCNKAMAPQRPPHVRCDGRPATNVETETKFMFIMPVPILK